MKALKFAAAIAACLLVAGCYEEDSKQAAEAMGFTNVRIEGHSFFGCGKDDSIRNWFTAIAPSGKVVEGVVCGGWSIFGKSFTVRVTKVQP